MYIIDSFKYYLGSRLGILIPKLIAIGIIYDIINI